MAIYNNGFPMTYQPYYPQYQPQAPQQAPQPAPQQQYPIVQGGFVRVMSENEARMYPVAPGNSVTFINENAPYCYTKTVDMSQLDRPKFERYRLVKEEDAPEAAGGSQAPQKTQAVDLSQYALATDLDPIQRELDAIKSEIETFRSDLYGLAGKKKIKKESGIDE